MAIGQELEVLQAQKREEDAKNAKATPNTNMKPQPQSAPNKTYANNGQGQKSYAQPSRTQANQGLAVPVKKVEEIPVEYVDSANAVMDSLKRVKSDGKVEFGITTSKIRGILALVSDIYIRENIRRNAELLPESINKIQSMRVRILYDAGRDKDVMNFVNRAKLLPYINSIGISRKKFIHFANYMEALVAYHRFYGGVE